MLLPLTATVTDLNPPQICDLRVHHFKMPAGLLSISLVHAQQVAGKQRRLLAALTGLDLEDRIGIVVWVPRRQQPGEPDRDLLNTRPKSIRLVCKRRVLVRELEGSLMIRYQLPVAAQSLDYWMQSRITTAGPAHQHRVSVRRGVSQLFLEPIMFGDEGVRALKQFCCLLGNRQ